MNAFSTGYNGFLEANLITPASNNFEYIAENVGAATNYASSQILALYGLQNPAAASFAAAGQPQVAGMFTRVYPATSGGALSATQN
jgi:hypothetical protein